MSPHAREAIGGQSPSPPLDRQRPVLRYQTNRTAWNARYTVFPGDREDLRRKVNDLVRMLGADSGISQSKVSRIYADLDAEVGTFRDPQQY
jgi:Transposase, Mutator family